MPFFFPKNRPLDIACLGRVAVDLYSEQIGCDLSHSSSFAKYLGGSSGNIAVGCARLGLKSAMISRVGDEQMGQFLIETLEAEGCDTRGVIRDRERLTALVLLGLRDKEQFPLLFYRENCADMALDAEDISEDLIKTCRALLITGTHLSQDGTLRASLKALEFAKKHGCVTVLDIDYRPVLWGITKRGDGETRYIADRTVTESLQKQLPHFDLLIGTEEEFQIAGGAFVGGVGAIVGRSPDLTASLKAVRAITAAVMVVKRGAKGCALIDSVVPSHIDLARHIAGKRIEVMNVLGAGDGFAAGLMSGLLEGLALPDAAVRANGCGALVVTRHGCAPAMPSRIELDYFLAEQSAAEGEGREPLPPHRDGSIAHLHRVTNARPAGNRNHWHELLVLAIDHRSQMVDLVRETGSDISLVPRLKCLIIESVAAVEKRLDLHGKVGVLIDGTGFGEAALYRAMERGWWVGRPIELPSSRPLRFESATESGIAYELEAAQILRSWPVSQTVKCLCFTDADDPVELRLEQEAKLLALFAATRSSGHELLIEIIPPKGFSGDAGLSLFRSLSRLYNIGIKPEWWKLPPQTTASWAKLAALIKSRDGYCRGMVILGLNAPISDLAMDFKAAKTIAMVKGFMVGRSIWVEPSRQWLCGKSSDQQLVETISAQFTTLIEAWRT